MFCSHDTKVEVYMGVIQYYRKGFAFLSMFLLHLALSFGKQVKEIVIIYPI
jgi:hypothetical protein